MMAITIQLNRGTTAFGSKLSNPISSSGQVPKTPTKARCRNESLPETFTSLTISEWSFPVRLKNWHLYRDKGWDMLEILDYE